MTTRLLFRSARARLPRAAALGTILLASIAPRLAAQHPLVTLPLDDAAYAQLDAMARVGCRAANVGPFRPYLVDDVRAAVRAAGREPACPPLILDALQRRFLFDSLAGIPDETRILLGDTLITRPDTGLRDTLGIDTTRVPPPDTTPDPFALPGLSAGALLTLRVTARGGDEFRPLWRDIRPATEGDPVAVALAHGRATWSAGPRFVAVSEIYLESSRRNDPTVRSKTVRGSGGFLDVGDAYATGRLGPVTASFGRADEAWLGRGRESLILSAHAPVLDRLLLSGRWRRVQARAVTALLEDVVMNEASDSLAPGTGNVRLHRAFVAHALTWTPVAELSITAGETMLFTRRGAPLDFAYFNPFLPYIVAQNDSARVGTEGRDNVTVFGAARIAVGPTTLEGELVVDDIQVDAKDRQRTADQLAFRAEGSFALPTTNPTIATVEYRRIGSFTYVRGFYSEAYQRYGVPIGSELGPDADLLHGEIAHWPNGLVRLATGVSLWRHGATRIERRPSESPNFHANEPFPSVRPDRPVVQKALTWTVDASVAAPSFPIDLGLEFSRITNANNQPSPAALYVRMHVVGHYALHYP